MSKRKVTHSAATVTLKITVDASSNAGSFGDDWQVLDIHERVEKEVRDRIANILSENRIRLLALTVEEVVTASKQSV